MSELRTREVEDLLNVLAGLNEPDDVFALLEDLFTIREIKDTSQRLEVARLCAKANRTLRSRRQRELQQPPSRASRKRSTMARVAISWHLRC